MTPFPEFMPRITDKLGRYASNVLGAWTQPNSFAGITTGTGAYFAGHKPTAQQGIMHQSVVPVDEYGYIYGAKPAYTWTSSQMALGAASNRPFAIFNNSGSGVVAEIEAIWAQKNMAAITGVAFRLGIDRITSLGNTAGAFTQVSLYPLNPLEAALPNSLVVFAGTSSSIIGINTAVNGVNSLYTRFLHSEETNVAAQVQEAFSIWPPAVWNSPQPSKLVAPPGYGYLITVTSAVGTYLFGIAITVASGP